MIGEINVNIGVFENGKLFLFCCIACHQKKKEKNKVIILNLSKDVNLLYFFFNFKALVTRISLCLQKVRKTKD